MANLEKLNTEKLQLMIEEKNQEKELAINDLKIKNKELKKSQSSNTEERQSIEQEIATLKATGQTLMTQLESVKNAASAKEEERKAAQLEIENAQAPRSQGDIVQTILNELNSETVAAREARATSATAGADETTSSNSVVTSETKNTSFFSSLPKIFTPHNHSYTVGTKEKIRELDNLKLKLVDKINERITKQKELLLKPQPEQQALQNELKDIIKAETDLRNKWITNLLSLESVSDSKTQTKFLKFIKERKNLEQVFNKIIDNKLNEEFGQNPGNDFFNRFNRIINKMDTIINNQNFIGGKIIQNIIDNINDVLEINVPVTGDTEDTEENQFIITLPKQEHYNLK